MVRKGWITYRGHKSMPVEVIGQVGSTYRVRFTTRRFGLRGRVGPVPVPAVSFVPPHLRGSV